MMKKTVFLLLIFILLFGVSQAAGAPASPASSPSPPPATVTSGSGQIFTLQDCIETALKNNLTLATATSRIATARDQLDQARSGRNPNFGFSGTFSKMGPSVSVTFGGQNVSIIPDTSYDLQLTLRQLITSFGILNKTIEASLINLQQSELEEQRVRDETVLKVQNAFYTLQEIEGLYSVAKENLKSQESHLQQSRHNFEVGIFPRFEVIRAEVSLAEARQRLITAENAVELAKASLKNLLALNMETHIDIQKEEDLPPFELSIDTAQQKALLKRPEVAQMNLALKLGQTLISLARSGQTPSIVLAGNLDFKNETLMSKSTGWLGALIFSTSLWDGGLTRAKVAEAREGLRQIQFQADDLKRNISLQVKQAYLYVQESLQKMEVARKTVEQANEAYSIASVRYEAALSTNLELQDAQLALNSAKSVLISAQCTYFLAKAHLDRAMGESWKGTIQ
ncbi:MAG: TolC family protein [bacterium]